MILVIKRGIKFSINFEKRVKPEFCLGHEEKNYPGTELQRKKNEDGFF